MGDATPGLGGAGSTQTTPFIVTVCIYIIVIVMFVIGIVLGARGLQTAFYQSLNTTVSATLTGSTLSFIIGYLFAAIGLIYLYYKEPENYNKLGFLSGILILGLALDLFWYVVFFYGQDIGVSVVIYILSTIVYVWYLYEIAAVSPFAAIFQLPLVLRTLVLLYQNMSLYLVNPTYTSIRPIPDRPLF